MMKKSTCFILIALIIVLVALASCQGELGNEEIVSQSVEAINKGEIDKAISYYAEDAKVKFFPSIPPESPNSYQGREELMAMFETMASNETHMEMEVQSNPGNLLITSASLTSDPIRELGLDPFEYEETYTVHDGKIEAVTFILKEDSLSNYLTAIAPEPETILGNWVLEGCCAVQFNADGTFEATWGRSEDSGTYSFSADGSLLSLASGEVTQACQAGDEGTHHIAIVQDSQLWLLSVDEQCDSRHGPSDFVMFTRGETDS